MMIAKEYFDSKTLKHQGRKDCISIADAYKAVDMAKNEFAESIIRMINNYREQNTKGDIAEYIQNYCEGYCEGIKYFI